MAATASAAGLISVPAMHLVDTPAPAAGKGAAVLPRALERFLLLALPSLRIAM